MKTALILLISSVLFFSCSNYSVRTEVDSMIYGKEVVFSESKFNPGDTVFITYGNSGTKEAVRFSDRGNCIGHRAIVR
jgi:hypothetical protein